MKCDATTHGAYAHAKDGDTRTQNRQEGAIALFFSACLPTIRARTVAISDSKASAIGCIAHMGSDGRGY